MSLSCRPLGTGEGTYLLSFITHKINKDNYQFVHDFPVSYRKNASMLPICRREDSNRWSDLSEVIHGIGSLKNSYSKLKNFLQSNSLFSRWGNWGREYLVRLWQHPPTHIYSGGQRLSYLEGQGEAWWGWEKGIIPLSDWSMEMEISPNEIFHYSSSGREQQRISVLWLLEFFSWKGWWWCLLSLYTKIM